MGKAARAIQISNREKLSKLKKVSSKTIKKNTVQPFKSETEQLAILLASGAKVKTKPTKTALIEDVVANDQTKQRKMTSKTRRRLQLIKAKPMRDTNPAQLVDK